MSRAAARLKAAHRPEYDRLYAEELLAVQVEVGELNALAAAQPGHDGHAPPAVALLKPGIVPIGETRADRIRTDVGVCPVCIGSHDRGHVCPACGASPTINQEEPCPTPTPTTTLTTSAASAPASSQRPQHADRSTTPPPAAEPPASDGLALADFPAILPDSVRAAALQVCAYAVDAADARAQLECLGLIPDPDPEETR